jgi:hypothetical protein
MDVGSEQPQATEGIVANTDNQSTAAARSEISARDWSIHGIVLKDAYIPYPNPRVVVSTKALIPGAKPADFLVKGDAQGCFAVNVPRLRSGGYITCRSAEKGDSGVSSPEVFVPEDESPPQLVLIATPRGRRIYGRVVDPSGVAIKGARVSNLDCAVESNSDGYYEMLIGNGVFAEVVMASCSGCATERRHIAHSVLPEVACDFTLTRCHVLAGVVRDQDGQTLAGAEVVVPVMGPARVFTDISGCYSIEVGDGRTPVVARKPGYTARWLSIEFPFTAEEGDFVLARGCTVFGGVWTDTGKPIAGARVMCGRGYEQVEARTDERGLYSLSGVMEGDVIVRASALGYPESQVEVVIMGDDASRSQRVDHLMRPGRFVEGRVVRGSGLGIPFPYVSAMPVSENGRQLGRIDMWGDSHGAFRVGPLPFASVDLVVRAKDMLSASHRISADLGSCQIEMKAAGRILGRVVDEATRRPVRTFVVRLRSPDVRGDEKGISGFGSEWRDGVVFVDEDGLWDTGTTPLVIGSLADIEIVADVYLSKLVRRVVAEDIGGSRRVEVAVSPR